MLKNTFIYFSLSAAIALFNCFNARSNTARGQATFNRINPLPSLPNIVPSFNVK